MNNVFSIEPVIAFGKEFNTVYINGSIPLFQGDINVNVNITYLNSEQAPNLHFNNVNINLLFKREDFTEEINEQSVINKTIETIGVTLV